MQYQHSHIDLLRLTTASESPRLQSPLVPELQHLFKTDRTEGTTKFSKDNQSSFSDWRILQKYGLVTRKEDSLLAVTVSSFVELESSQCSRRPVGLERCHTRVSQNADIPYILLFQWYDTAWTAVPGEGIVMIKVSCISSTSYLHVPQVEFCTIFQNTKRSLRQRHESPAAG